MFASYSLKALTRRKATAVVLAEAAENELDEHGNKGEGLNKVLSARDVIAYGVSTTVGAGIFAITGSGAGKAGPAIVISFLVAAVACLFSAFSYMEFAARVPIAGSAYTFAYVCMGELAAWFVGWNLTLEYAISAAVVARAWASNVQLFIEQVGGTCPTWLVDIPIEGGVVINHLSLLSALICFACTAVLMMGVKESSNFNIFITILTITVLVFIIVLGSFHVTPENWTAPQPPQTDSTFFPMGGNGILTGAAMVFFSYIGFDSVTTLAEEVQNPTRDVPLGIIATLIISTGLYVGVSLVVTGMQAWFDLDSGAPLAKAFSHVGLEWAATLISTVTVIGISGTCLTSLFGQPRIFYRMARDGLLPGCFGVISPKTKVPVWGTLVTGVGAGLIAFFIPLDSLVNMISIGTLLAFTTVCAGVVILRYEQSMPNVGVVNNDALGHFANNTQLNDRLIPGSKEASVWRSPVLWLAIFLIPCVAFCVALRNSDEWPLWVVIVCGVLSVVPVFVIWRLPVCERNIPKPGLFVCPFVPWLPCLGIFINVYLIASLDLFSYVRMVVWTALGMAIYFFYGIIHSTLRGREHLDGSSSSA